MLFLSYIIYGRPIKSQSSKLGLLFMLLMRPVSMKLYYLFNHAVLTVRFSSARLTTSDK